jgi:hypothetical protein
MSPRVIVIAASLAASLASSSIAATPALAERAHRHMPTQGGPASWTSKGETSGHVVGAEVDSAAPGADKPRSGWNGFYSGANGGAGGRAER